MVARHRGLWAVLVGLAVVVLRLGDEIATFAPELLRLLADGEIFRLYRRVAGETYQYLSQDGVGVTRILLLLVVVGVVVLALDYRLRR